MNLKLKSRIPFLPESLKKKNNNQEIQKIKSIKQKARINDAGFLMHYYLLINLLEAVFEASYPYFHAARDKPNDQFLELKTRF